MTVTDSMVFLSTRSGLAMLIVVMLMVSGSDRANVLQWAVREGDVFWFSLQVQDVEQRHSISDDIAVLVKSVPELSPEVYATHEIPEVEISATWPNGTDVAFLREWFAWLPHPAVPVGNWPLLASWLLNETEEDMVITETDSTMVLAWNTPVSRDLIVWVRIAYFKSDGFFFRYHMAATTQANSTTYEVNALRTSTLLPTFNYMTQAFVVTVAGGILCIAAIIGWAASTIRRLIRRRSPAIGARDGALSLVRSS
ncbi:MAG: hypothetical protein ACTSVD_07840 [Candidatus Thorarchaeota archaeon]